jgi:hypothetical protein
MKRLWIILFLFCTVWGQDKIKVSGYFDEVIDNNVLTLQIKSENTQIIGNEDKHAILIIKSDGGELSLKVFWGNIYLGLGARSVTYRIGTNDSITELWESSNDYTVTISKNPVEILKKMAKNRKILFRVTPYQKNAITFEFDVSELKSVVEEFPNHFAIIRPPSITERIGEISTIILIGGVFFVILFGL